MNEKMKAKAELENGSKQNLAANYQSILTLIKTYAKTHKRSFEPKLLAVSKGHSIEAIKAIADLGQVRFGENYAQELLDKASKTSDTPIEFVFIGHLQSNKIKKIVSVAAEIQTVGTYDQARRIAKAAEDCGKTPFPIYLQVNADAEAAKHGVSLSELQPLYDKITRELPELLVKGIMAIPSPRHSKAFETEGKISELYLDLRQKTNLIGQKHLSLGTTSDIELAIIAGTDELRIGTALFGPRNKQ